MGRTWSSAVGTVRFPASLPAAPRRSRTFRPGAGAGLERHVRPRPLEPGWLPPEPAVRRGRARLDPGRRRAGRSPIGRGGDGLVLQRHSRMVSSAVPEPVRLGAAGRHVSALGLRAWQRGDLRRMVLVGGLHDRRPRGCRRGDTEERDVGSRRRACRRRRTLTSLVEPSRSTGSSQLLPTRPRAETARVSDSPDRVVVGNHPAEPGVQRPRTALDDPQPAPGEGRLRRSGAACRVTRARTWRHRALTRKPYRLASRGRACHSAVP